MSTGQIVVITGCSLLLGIGIGGLFQCWLGFRPNGWQATNGKRFRTIEIKERP